MGIQRGSCYELSVQSLIDFFQVFGKVDNLEYNEEKGKGFVVFNSEEVALSLLYKNLMIAECVVFTWKSLLSLGENPEPGLLLNRLGCLQDLKSCQSCAHISSSTARCLGLCSCPTRKGSGELWWRFLVTGWPGPCRAPSRRLAGPPWSSRLCVELPCSVYFVASI